MKRKFLSLLFVAIASSVNAQIANWLIKPAYDKVELLGGIDGVVTDSLGIKSLWTFNGTKLATTPLNISPFKEKKSVLVDPETLEVKGILSENGIIRNCEVGDVTYDYPYFSNNKLLIYKDSNYLFITTDGKTDGKKYGNAYPYSNGYASCLAFLNTERQKDPYLLMIDKDGNPVNFTFGGKKITATDIEFVSSVNDDNVAFLVIKGKVYAFDAKTQELSSVSMQENDDNLKNQAKLEGDINSCLSKQGNSYTLKAISGKDGIILVKFDNLLKPTSIIRGDTETEYTITNEEVKTYPTSLTMDLVDDRYGVYWDGKEMLPPQFLETGFCFDDKIIMRFNGKFGMMAINKGAQFQFKMNKGNDVAFLHQKFETSIRVDLPTYVSSDRTYIEIDPATGCDIDKTSREKRDTESGNFVEYNCILSIPNDLPDETTDITYPLQVVYGGIKSSILKHTIKGWYYKKFEIEEDESQRSLNNGTLTFVFNVRTVQSDGHLYPTEVSIVANNLNVEREDKMSETRYKYKVHNLHEGVNNITVQIVEQGCPPTSFPFEVEYYKPKSAQKERVVITKKPVSKVTPRLEI